MHFLKAILNNIDEGIIVIDRDGVILFINEATTNLGKSLSLTKSFNKGERLQDVVHPDRKDVVQEMINEVKGKRQSSRTFAEYSMDGATVYLEVTYIPVNDKKEELLNIIVFMRDITPQKVLEKKLTTQVMNSNNLIEKANAIIVGVDTSGYITDWNDHCNKVTGFDKSEVYGQKLTEKLLQEAEQPVFDILLARILNKELVSNYELAVSTKAGESVMFLLSATPRTTPNGKIIGVMFVGHDVTELAGYRRSLEKKVEERTRELKRVLNKEKAVVEMKNRFVSIASHEFRTPLSSIQFEADFIRKHKKISHDDLIKRLIGIEKQVGHMNTLLDDVLTYGRSESGKIQLMISMIEVLDFTNKIVKDVSQSTKNTHAIHATFHQLPQEIATDEKLLRNIVINLLTNAIKFSPGHKNVYLTMTGLKGQILITVRDEGIGIPAHEVDKIFEPFIRGRAASAIQGTGLGLSIAKKGVELLGGTISVESQEGKGALFTVAIPEYQK